MTICKEEVYFSCSVLIVENIAKKKETELPKRSALPPDTALHYVEFKLSWIFHTSLLKEISNKLKRTCMMNFSVTKKGCTYCLMHNRHNN